MKIFRKEHFGGVLYDTETLRFDLVDEKPSNNSIDKVIEKEPAMRTDIISAPVRAYFELLQRCNLACRHCFVSATSTAPYGQSTERIAEALDELEHAGVMDVRFTGGEITVRRDIWEILWHAKKNGFSISVNTNGVYDDPLDTAKRFSELDLEQVTLSVDGMQANHDYMRGRGNYQRTVEAMRLMHELGVNLRINTVLTKRNKDDIPELIELAAKYVQEINFFYMRPIGRAVKEAHTSLSFEEHFETSQVALALREKYPHLSIMHFEQSFTERSVEDFCRDLQKGYPYGNTTVNLDWQGNVWPHGYTTYQDDRFNVGNIHDTPLRVIWEDSGRLDKIRSWYRALIERCSGCDEYKRRCAGYNFEMELAQSLGVIDKNPFCVSDKPVPKFSLNGSK